MKRYPVQWSLPALDTQLSAIETAAYQLPAIADDLEAIGTALAQIHDLLQQGFTVELNGTGGKS